MEKTENRRKSAYELAREADAILRQKGFDIFGRKIEPNGKARDIYLQNRFEDSMFTGAYCGQRRR